MLLRGIIIHLLSFLTLNPSSDSSLVRKLCMHLPTRHTIPLLWSHEKNVKIEGSVKRLADVLVNCLLQSNLINIQKISDDDRQDNQKNKKRKHNKNKCK